MGSEPRRSLAIECQRAAEMDSKGGVWWGIWVCKLANWVGFNLKENDSILYLLVGIQWSPTGSTRRRESGGLAEAETGGLGGGVVVMVPREGSGGDVTAVAAPKSILVMEFMKAAGEKASPRTWAQVSPIDIPLHLNLVTFIQYNAFHFIKIELYRKILVCITNIMAFPSFLFNFMI